MKIFNHIAIAITCLQMATCQGAWVRGAFNRALPHFTAKRCILGGAITTGAVATIKAIAHATDNSIINPIDGSYENIAKVEFVGGPADFFSDPFYPHGISHWMNCPETGNTTFNEAIPHSARQDFTITRRRTGFLGLLGLKYKYTIAISPTDAPVTLQRSLTNCEDNINLVSLHDSSAQQQPFVSSDNRREGLFVKCGSHVFSPFSKVNPITLYPRKENNGPKTLLVIKTEDGR